MAPVESSLQVNEKVFQAVSQHFGDEGDGRLPFAGDVELGVVVRSLWCVSKERFEVSVPCQSVGDVGTDAGGLGRSWAK